MEKWKQNKKPQGQNNSGSEHIAEVGQGGRGTVKKKKEKLGEEKGRISTLCMQSIYVSTRGVQ